MSIVPSHDPFSINRLIAERDSIMLNRQFGQSPTLVRLLRYLVERAMVDPLGKVTQYDIAVEAMGKANVFDLGNESYARVIVSRLRKALAQHYAANAPVAGLCLHVPKGSYSVELAPMADAYPQQLAEAEPSTPRLPESTNERLAAQVEFRSGRKLRTTGLGLLFVATLLVAVGIAAAFWIWDWRGEPGLAMSPVVEIVSQNGDDDPDSLAVRPVEDLARSLVTSSLVARISEGDKSDYILGIAADPAGGPTRMVAITLEDTDGNLISSAEYPIDPGNPATLDQVRAYLIDLFRPSGILTDVVLSKIDRERPRSAYECYIAIDDNRSVVVRPDAVDDCVTRFGDDRMHLPNVIARNAFAMYVEDLRSGGEVRANGRGWAEAQRAFRHGSSSVYTNVLLARVDFAEGRCERGLHRMERMNHRMEVFPSLRAMMLTDGMPCITDPAEKISARQEIRKLVSYNIDAAPILRSYLVLASIEAGDFQSARKTLHGRRGGTILGKSLTELYAVLDEALVAGRPVDPDRMRKIVRVFVWNPQARATIIRSLSGGPQTGVS